MNRRLLSTIAVALGIAASQVLPIMADSQCDPAIDYLSLARTQYDAGEFTLSLESYGCALSFDADSATAYLGRGNTARNLGQYQQSIDDYTQAIDLREDLAIAYNNRGWSYYNLGEYDTALADYNQALQIDPNLGYAYNNRGLVYQMLRNLTLAEADFAQAIRLNAEPTPWAQHNLDNLNEWREIINAGQETAINLPIDSANNPSIDALLMDASAAWYSNEWELTIERASAVIAVTTENANAYIYRGDSYYVLDRFEEALADFDRAIELDPDNAYALDGRAYTKAYLGNFVGARADYERARTIQNIFVNDHLTLGTIESVAGNAEAAGVEFLVAMEMLGTEHTEHEAVEIGDEIAVDMAEGRVVTLPFVGEAGQVISFNAMSDEADALLVLLDPDGEPVAGDDDSGTHLNATLPAVELPSDGTYTLLVGHAGGGSEGTITVVMTAQ